jgi:hypothetical protein
MLHDVQGRHFRTKSRRHGAGRMGGAPAPVREVNRKQDLPKRNHCRIPVDHGRFSCRNRRLGSRFGPMDAPSAERPFVRELQGFFDFCYQLSSSKWLRK